MGAASLICLAVVCIRFVIVRAQPILRTRVIETLSARFKGRVELANIHVWVDGGVHVQGEGLKVFGATDPNPFEPGVQPLFDIERFEFHTSLRSLFREPMHVDTTFVSGLTLNIPPKNDRQQIKVLGPHGQKLSIVVDHFVIKEAKLLINTDRPGKKPLEFAIDQLRLTDIGPAKPFRFDATLVNPKPVGDIQSTGLFGPLNERDPRETAVSGGYSFTGADLGTIRGIAGILSSTGEYSGTLGRIEVNGKTDTPDFGLAISGHRLPLQTTFHAIVDGTDGDTYLEPINATLLHSSFTARGKIVRVSGAHGHDIELNVSIQRARIDDLLRLGVKTDPPVMRGAIDMRTHLSLMPGEGDVAERIGLVGTFHIVDGYFSSDKIQTKIDDLSLRGRGKPKLINQGSEDSVPSDLQGRLNLQSGVLTFRLLHFEVPGAHADLQGEYSLDGSTFDFQGILKTEAKLSQMTSGWKSLLLKPVDPFFHKNGNGAEIPFKVTGTRSSPHFGLDLHRKTPLSLSDHSQSTTN